MSHRPQSCGSCQNRSYRRGIEDRWPHVSRVEQHQAAIRSARGVRCGRQSRRARMAKLADAADLKSADPQGLWGFKSPSGHHGTIDQRAAYCHKAKPSGLDPSLPQQPDLHCLCKTCAGVPPIANLPRWMGHPATARATARAHTGILPLHCVQGQNDNSWVLRQKDGAAG